MKKSNFVELVNRVNNNVLANQIIPEQIIEGVVNMTSDIIPQEFEQNENGFTHKFAANSIVLFAFNKQMQPTKYINFGLVKNRKIVPVLLKLFDFILPYEYRINEQKAGITDLFNDPKGGKGNKNYLNTFLSTPFLFVTNEKGYICWSFASADMNLSDTLLGAGNHATLLQKYTDIYLSGKPTIQATKELKDLVYQTVKFVEKQFNFYATIRKDIANFEKLGQQFAEYQKQQEEKAKAAAEAEAAAAELMKVREAEAKQNAELLKVYLRFNAEVARTFDTYIDTEAIRLKAEAEAAEKAAAKKEKEVIAAKLKAAEKATKKRKAEAAAKKAGKQAV